MCGSCNKNTKKAMPQGRPMQGSAKKASPARMATNPWATTPKIKSNFKIGRS